MLDLALWEEPLEISLTPLVVNKKNITFPIETLLTKKYLNFKCSSLDFSFYGFLFYFSNQWSKVLNIYFRLIFCLWTEKTSIFLSNRTLTPNITQKKSNIFHYFSHVSKTRTKRKRFPPHFHSNIQMASSINAIDRAPCGSHSPSIQPERRRLHSLKGPDWLLFDVGSANARTG